MIMPENFNEPLTPCIQLLVDNMRFCPMILSCTFTIYFCCHGAEAKSLLCTEWSWFDPQQSGSVPTQRCEEFW